MINSKEIDKILRNLPNHLWYSEPILDLTTSEEINSLTKLIKIQIVGTKALDQAIEIEIFERNFSKYCKVKNSIAVVIMEMVDM